MEPPRETPANDRAAQQANAAFAGFLLVSIGIAFFLIQSGTLRGLNAAGILLMAVGLAFLSDGAFRHATSAGAAATRNNRVIAGAILVAVGAVATTDLDAWPLILVLVGGLLVGRAVMNARLIS